MAAPNIAGLTSIIGKTGVQNCTTSPSSIITNSAASGQVFKINTVLATNKAEVSADVTVDIFRSSVAYPIASTITVPDKSAIVLSGKDTAFYLEEGDILRISATANASIVITTSYEIIS